MARGRGSQEPDLSGVIMELGIDSVTAVVPQCLLHETPEITASTGDFSAHRRYLTIENHVCALCIVAFASRDKAFCYSRPFL